LRAAKPTREGPYAVAHAPTKHPGLPRVFRRLRVGRLLHDRSPRGFAGRCRGAQRHRRGALVQRAACKANPAFRLLIFHVVFHPLAHKVVTAPLNTVTGALQRSQLLMQQAHISRRTTSSEYSSSSSNRSVNFLSSPLFPLPLPPLHPLSSAPERSLSISSPRARSSPLLSHDLGRPAAHRETRAGSRRPVPAPRRESHHELSARRARARRLHVHSPPRRCRTCEDGGHDERNKTNNDGSMLIMIGIV